MSRELDHLIGRYIDGSLGDREAAALETMLHDPDAAAEVVDQLLMSELMGRALDPVRCDHAFIDSLMTRIDAVGDARFVRRVGDSIDGLDRRRRRLTIYRAVGAIAAALLVAAAVLAIVLRTPPAIAPAPTALDIASVIDVSGGGTLVVNDQLAHAGLDFAAGAISLDAGQAEFLLRGGTSVRLVGRSRLTIHDRMRATLSHGSATFNCPPAAKGFAVELPGEVRVTDLGTEFTVGVDEAGRTSVSVSEGVVRVDRPLGPAFHVEAGWRCEPDADRFGERVEVVRDLPIVNGSFEIDGGNRAGGPMPLGWRSAIPGRAGCEDHNANGNLTAGVDGRFVALVNYRLSRDPQIESSMTQDTDHRVETSLEYRLTVAVGRRLDQDARGSQPTAWRIELIDADTGDVLAASSGTIEKAGVMTDQAAHFTASPADAGRRLAVRLVNPQDEAADPNPGQANFDNVRLETSRSLDLTTASADTRDPVHTRGVDP